MFENDIEVLKSILDETVREYNTLENALITNNKNERNASELMKLERETESSKQSFISSFLLLNVGLLLIIILFVSLSPANCSTVLPWVLVGTCLVCGIDSIVKLFDWISSKEELKELATDEINGYVNDLESIKAKGVELNEQCSYLEEKISNYSELIGYLTDYNDMIAYLDSIKESKADEINQMLDEYLNEKVDYSKVHFSNELPEDFHYKKLSNVLKK